MLFKIQPLLFGRQEPNDLKKEDNTKCKVKEEPTNPDSLRRRVKFEHVKQVSFNLIVHFWRLCKVAFLVFIIQSLLFGRQEPKLLRKEEDTNCKQYVKASQTLQLNCFLFSMVVVIVFLSLIVFLCCLDIGVRASSPFMYPNNLMLLVHHYCMFYLSSFKACRILNCL